MNTIRENIIGQIMSRLAVITKLNGYATDIGTNVFRVRKSLESSDLPASSVFPEPETAEAKYGGLTLTMPVRIEALATFGAENPSVISELMLGDLIRAITDPAWVRSPQYDEAIRYHSGGTDEYPNEEDLTVGVSALFEVVYTTRIGDPCSP